MGAPAKAKPVRLIDFLYLLGENEIVVVTVNHGRNSYSNTCKQLEIDLKDYLTSNIKGIQPYSGTIQIFV